MNQKALIQLDELHYLHDLIQERQLSVELSDDFTKQCVALEKYLRKSDEIAKTSKKLHRTNILSGIFCAPLILGGLALLMYYKIFEGQLSLSDLFEQFYPLVLAVGISIVVGVLCIVRFYALKSRLEKELYPDLLEKLGS